MKAQLVDNITAKEAIQLIKWAKNKGIEELTIIGKITFNTILKTNNGKIDKNNYTARH